MYIIITTTTSNNNDILTVLMKFAFYLLPLNRLDTHLTKVKHTTYSKILGDLTMHLYPHFGHGGNAIFSLPQL